MLPAFGRPGDDVRLFARVAGSLREGHFQLMKGSVVYMKNIFTHTIKVVLMAAIVAAVPMFVFAAKSGSDDGSYVRYILYAGIAIAFVIDMWHESKRRR
jgi:hypothetical protein